MRTLILFILFCVPSVAISGVLFEDDFESGLKGWEISRQDLIRIIDSGDPNHGKVLLMRPGGENVLALFHGSENWKGYRIEGEIYFPDSNDNYFGIIYNYKKSERRTDFGSIYIKGNDSYIRVNPRYDWNPSRMIFEEYKTDLKGEDAVQIGKWQRFAAEVIGNTCHFYVGNSEIPKVTLDLYDRDSGKAGIKPRVVGGDVWMDRIRAVSIENFQYSGPALPAGIQDYGQDLIREWYSLGPFSSVRTEVESSPGRSSNSISEGNRKLSWRKFETDKRGAVMTGRLAEFLGDRTVAYFSTTVQAGESGAELQLSTIDNLAVWVNGEFWSYVDRGEYAWYDFGRNPKHPPTLTLPLPAGTNHLLIRVRGGQYATGGFYARVMKPTPK